MKWILVIVAIATPLTVRASPLEDMLKRYDDCVLTVSLGIKGNRYEAAERSFFACQTEEQALRAMAASPYAEQGLAIRKLKLKRIILGDPQ